MNQKTLPGRGLKNNHQEFTQPYIYILSNYFSIMLIVLYADTLFFSKGVSHSASLWEAKLKMQQKLVHAPTIFLMLRNIPGIVVFCGLQRYVL